MISPRISVIVPCYNHARFVERALRSVAAQDDPDLELVVVDDGSTDGSREVIARVLRALDLPGVVYHEQANAGAHAAIEKGIQLSSGQVIAILNSDDTHAPTRFARLRPHFRPGQEFLLFSALSIVDAEDLEVAPRTDLSRWYHTALRQSAQCPTVGFALLCNNLCVTSGNLVFSRGLHQRVGGLRPFRYCHDWDFVLRCTRHVEPVFVPEILGCYRLHESNTIEAADRAAVDAEYARIVTEYLELCEREPPGNALAPCRANWPVFFPYFARTHTRFDSRRVVDLVGREDLTAFPTGGFERWSPWSAGALELSRRDDLGVLLGEGAASAGGPRSALECRLLLRELALVRLGAHERYPDFASGGLSDLELARTWGRLITAREPAAPTAGPRSRPSSDSTSLR